MSTPKHDGCRIGPHLAAVRPAFALIAGSMPLLAHADYSVNLQLPASGLAQQIFDLHSQILWVCLGIMIVVFVPMLIALIWHRKSIGHPAAKFHDNLGIEIAWTVVPVLIMLAMAWPATTLIRSMKDTSRPDLTIKVTGHQWKWEYEYLGEGIRFLSSSSTPKAQIDGDESKGEHYLLEVDHPLMVPAGKKVRLVLTSSDVIHSWWVPALGVKQDAIPGFIRDSWFQIDEPGIYRGQCAKLCGIGHGFMPVVVEAVGAEQFAAWKQQQQILAAQATASSGKTYAMAELKALGEKVYETNCAACHQATGAGIPGAIPALNGSPVVAGEKSGHIDVVLNGRAGTAMAAFGKQLSDLDLAAAITYERNSWNNTTGDVVQPADIAARRTGSPK